jgi:hypothetical protein
VNLTQHIPKNSNDSSDTFWDESDNGTDTFPQTFDFPPLPGEKSIWSTTEDKLDSPIIYGEIIFHLENGRDESYGLVTTMDGSEEVYTYLLPQGNKTGHLLKVGDTVGFEKTGGTKCKVVEMIAKG